MTGPELASHIRAMEHEHRQQRREKSVIGRMVPWCLFGGLNICAVAVPLILALTAAAD